MKKMIRSFEQPTEEKDLSNYIDVKSKCKRGGQLDRARNLHKIDSAEAPDRPEWWHDPGYDITGRPIPEYEDAAISTEVELFIKNQRFTVDDSGDVELNVEDIDSWAPEYIENEYYVEDASWVIEEFLESFEDVVKFPEIAGEYILSCYVDLVVDFVGSVLDDEERIVEEGTPKVNWKHTTLDDLKIEKVS